MSSAYYKKLLTNAENELKKYKARKSQLETLWSNYGSFDSDASDMNQYIGRASGYMQEAVKISGGSVDVGGVWGSLDFGTGDSNLSTSRAYVNTELTRVVEKIEELKKQIETLKRKIAQEKEKEKAGNA